MSRSIAASALLAVAISSMPYAEAQTWKPSVAVLDGKTSNAFPATPAMDLGRFGTIEFWVQPTWTKAPDYDPVILSYLGDAGPIYAITMTADRQAIGLLGGKDWDLAQFNFADNKLHHVAFVVVGEATDVYIDGKYQDTLLIGFGAGTGKSFHIGSLDGVSGCFQGGVAGVRIWNTPLDGDAINNFKMVDIATSAGATHPDYDALVGIDDFKSGKPGFMLTGQFVPASAAALTIPAGDKKAKP